MKIEHEIKERYGVGQKLMRVTGEEPVSGEPFEIVVEVIGSGNDLIDIGVWDETGHGHYARLTVDEARKFSRRLDSFVSHPLREAGGA